MSISAQLGGSVAKLLAEVVDAVTGLLGDRSGHGNGATVQVADLASIALNAQAGTGTLATVQATTSQSVPIGQSQGQSDTQLAANVGGLVGNLVGGVIDTLSLLLGGVSSQTQGQNMGMGFSLNVGNLVSVAVNQTPANAALLSIGLDTHTV